ncbi:MAG: hypothetical protein ACR2PR_07425 [Pseudohongiellaceae bacterium]
MEDIKEVITVRKMGIEAMKLVMAREERQQNHEMQIAQLEDQRQIRQLDEQKRKDDEDRALALRQLDEQKRKDDADRSMALTAQTNDHAVAWRKQTESEFTLISGVVQAIPAATKAERHWQKESLRHLTDMYIASTFGAQQQQQSQPQAQQQPAAPGMLYDARFLAQKNGRCAL